MSTNLLGEAVANMGSFVVNTTDLVSVVCDAIVVTEDAVFTNIYIGATDKKAEYIQDTTIAVKAGTIITPKGDAQFTGVKLASGQVTLVLG